jgi:hypothetical protein
VNDDKKLVAAAVAKAEAENVALLAFKVYSDKVVIALGDGRKLSYDYSDLWDWIRDNDGSPAEAEQPAKVTRKRRRTNTRKSD